MNTEIKQMKFHNDIAWMPILFMKAIDIRGYLDKDFSWHLILILYVPGIQIQLDFHNGYRWIL